MESRPEAPCLACIKESGNASYEENMAVVMWGVASSRVGMFVPDGFKLGHGVRKNPYRVIVGDNGEGCMNGYQYCSHDGVGFVRIPNVDVMVLDYGAGWDVDHRRPQPNLSFYIRSVGICLLVRYE